MKIIYKSKKKIAIRRFHSWIRHIILLNAQKHEYNAINHDGIISGFPLRRTRLVIGPVLQYMPDPRTRTEVASKIEE